MDAGQFAEFWERQGCRVIETNSCYWFNSQPLSFASIPYHRVVDPPRTEIAEVFFRGPALAVRFLAGPAENGQSGGLFVRSKEPYDLSSLQKKARNQTRRGLEHCRVERMEFSDLAQRGHKLNVGTFFRQGRSPTTMTEAKWALYCSAAARHSDFEAWVALVAGQWAALLVTALVEDVLTILHQSSAGDHLAYYPNNALVFEVTRRKLNDARVRLVSYGLLGLTDNGSLEHFKLGMGFSLQPLRDQVVINPVLKPFMDLGGRRWVEWRHRRRPDCDFWRKASEALAPARAGIR